MAYQNGNLALKPKRKPEQQTYRERKTIVVKKKTLPVQEKLLYMFSIIVGVIVAGIIIFRYAQIYEINLEVRKLSKQYDTMAIEMKELEKKVQSLSDPERIKQMAESEGMTSADQDVTVQRKDSASNKTLQQ
ncbi:cell division protein FtsL [Paenibacillus sp. GCM10027626]|uniref:cell division protein FtsL n=1 Tax=Paenibacillus sp. GCM10027626 TaxID=3273411 RepID=UPI003628966E